MVERDRMVDLAWQRTRVLREAHHLSVLSVTGLPLAT
jgi:hypothetical protein